MCIQALNLGYRHVRICTYYSVPAKPAPTNLPAQIDSAAVYKNEAGCGAAIRKIAASIPREDIFFTSKVPGRTLGYESAKAQVAKTLEVTGLDYVDLMLLHAPVNPSFHPSPSNPSLRPHPLTPLSTAVRPPARPPGRA